MLTCQQAVFGLSFLKKQSRERFGQVAVIERRVLSIIDFTSEMARSCRRTCCRIRYHQRARSKQQEYGLAIDN